MSRDLALYTSKNDNFLFQNQQWLSWQLQPTQPFPSDAGSFSSLTYNIYHTTYHILHHIAVFIVSSSFHTSRAFFHFLSIFTSFAFFHFHCPSKFTSLAYFPLSLSFQLASLAYFPLSLSFQIHQPRIFSTFTFLPNSPASHFPISLSIPSKFLTYPLSPPLHPKDWAPETGIKMICSIYETIYSPDQNFNAFWGRLFFIFQGI